MLGGWGNTQSVVRKRRKEPSNVAVQTRGIVSAHEYRGFWIKLVGDAIVVGKESEVGVEDNTTVIIQYLKKNG